MQVQKRETLFNTLERDSKLNSSLNSLLILSDVSLSKDSITAPFPHLHDSVLSGRKLKFKKKNVIPGFNLFMLNKTSLV